MTGAPPVADTAPLFAHDVKGWSGDFLANEGRKALNLALRFEYRQRYLAEVGYLPVWGGDYNPFADPIRWRWPWACDFD